MVVREVEGTGPEDLVVKEIRESRNKEHWPRKKYASVECRKRDLIFRITDWWDDKDEPGIDVEAYIGGVYDWHESKTFTKSAGFTKADAKVFATQFVAKQMVKLF